MVSAAPKNAVALNCGRRNGILQRGKGLGGYPGPGRALPTSGAGVTPELDPGRGAWHQSSRWLTMPSASLGSNQVDLGGMMPPASDTAIRSSMAVG